MDKRVFGGRYEITEKVGMGGMAEVFKASDSTLGRTVAVKVMLPQYAADSTFAARFRQEAQAAANLTSPYIVNIYDWGKDDEMYYIVMEYVRGTDLKTAVQQRGAIHPRKVAEIGSQVCSALSVAHSYGIIHRDIKSANIMVQTDGNVKVMDFGIAQAGNSDMTQDSSVLGTAHYVSPEQAQGKHLTGASDLYSLGIVMYEAATGQLPFDGPDAVSVAVKQVNEQPVPPREINPKIDRDLEAIIMKALSKNVETRWASANEMRQALDDYLAGRSAGATGATGAYAGTDTTRLMDPVKGNSAAHTTLIDNNFEEEEKKSGAGKKVLIALLIILVLAGCGIGIAVATGSFAEKIIVPNVVGMTEQEARSTITEYGFTVGDVKYKTSDTVAEGLVISQNPDANTSAESDSKINIVVSSGTVEPTAVEVPDLSGKTAAEAEALLAQVGLVGAANEDYSDSVEEGKICSQSPNAKEAVQKGSTVTYYVSKGKHTATVTNVEGWNASSAKSELSGKGFNVSISYESTTDSSKDGIVARTNPSAGTTASYGSSVTLYVYQYTDPTPEPTPDPTPTTPTDTSGSTDGGTSQDNTSTDTGGTTNSSN